MTDKEMFSSLVENAFDFLKESLAQLKEKPKFSVINFYSGLELLIKARLMAEHWTLVVSTKSSEAPDRDRFEAGNFVSITFSEAARLLKNTLKIPLSAQQERIFHSMGAHRNSFVHFYHRELSSEAKTNVIKRIGIEQLTAWSGVRELLTGAWSDTFEAFDQEIRSIGETLKNHHEYLEVRFSEIRETMAKKTKSGRSFIKCPSCQFKAFEVKGGNDSVQDGSCHVCDTRGPWLFLDCPHCKEKKIHIQGGYDYCPACRKEITPEDIEDALEDRVESIEDGEKHYSPLNCGECEHADSVRLLDGEITCLNCLTMFEESDINICGWCHERYAGGDAEHSYVSGCGQCEGALANAD